MNKSALSMAVFGFAAGILLFVVVEPLLPPKPKTTTAPQLATMITETVPVVPGGNQPSDKNINRAPTETQPSVPSPPSVPRDDPVIQAAKAAVAKNLKDPPSAVFSDLKRAMRPNVRGEPMDTVCGLVNAKNSYGGYNGPRGFVYFVDGGTADIAEGDQYAVGPMVVRNFCKNG
jgi:hypothetical protein